ncbi:hypothetical protein GCM10028803_17380 [Larkinella knui]
MNEDTWYTVLQALPTTIDTPLVIFDNPVQALSWIQLNNFETDNFWIVTNNELQYWVVAQEVGMQLIHMGFKRTIVIPPPTPPQSLEAPGDEKV